MTPLARRLQRWRASTPKKRHSRVAVGSGMSGGRGGWEEHCGNCGHTSCYQPTFDEARRVLDLIPCRSKPQEMGRYGHL